MAMLRTIARRAGACAFGVASGLFAVGVCGLAFWAGRLGPDPPVTPVNLPVVYPDPMHADAKLEHPVHHQTLCPTPAQKEAAFGDLPEPARLPHPDAPRELADPGPPAEAADVTIREAEVRFRRMKMRLDGAAEDAAWLEGAIAKAKAEGAKP